MNLIKFLISTIIIKVYTFCSWYLPSLILLLKSSIRFLSIIYGRTSSLFVSLHLAIHKKSPTFKLLTSYRIPLLLNSEIVASSLDLVLLLKINSFLVSSKPTFLFSAKYNNWSLYCVKRHIKKFYPQVS